MIKDYFSRNFVKFVILSLISVFVLLSGQNANALNGSDFNPGRIIDDAVFYNDKSMSPSQIQQFLDSKLPTCDTNGAKMYNSTQTRAQWAAANGRPLPPYICLKSYTQAIPSVTNSGSNLCKNSIVGGTKSAAQIIHDVAQACGINPQVLIVMLQKEMSLITDDWPWPTQYDKAMGYACPDSGPNNSANCDSAFFGFFNQVYNAAQAYRRYEANPDSYNYKAGRNNFILYNPNTACGGSNVFIENQATASLYIYTPYQPNASALNNLYGSGDSCGAYGNRNFWRLFNDWFGSPFGSLVRTVESSTLYYTDGEQKYLITSMNTVYEYGFNLTDVRYLTNSELQQIPTASTPYSSSLKNLIRTPYNSTVYLVSVGQKFPIGSWEMVSDYGFTGNDIGIVSDSAINRLILGSNLSTVAKSINNNTVYGIENGQRRIVFELSKLNELLLNANLSKLSDFYINRLSYGIPLVDGDYSVRVGSAIRVYNGSNYYEVPGIGTYSCWGISDLRKFTVSSFSKTSGSNSGKLSCIAKKQSDSSDYIISDGKKYPLQTGHGLTTVTVNDNLIDSLPSKELTPVIKGSTSTLSFYGDSIRRDIPSMGIFSKLGYTSNDVTTIPGSVFEKIPKGANMLTPGTLVSTAGNSTIYVTTSDNTKVAIPSAETFKDFGFSWSGIIPINATTDDHYATNGNLSNLILSNNELYYVHNLKRHLITVDLDTHYNINRFSFGNTSNEVIGSTSTTIMSRFIKSKNTSTVYYVDSGTKRPVSSWSKLIEIGGNNNIVNVGVSFLGSLPTGSQI